MNFSHFVQQSHEVLKGVFSKSVENVTDMSVPLPGKDEEKHLIRILLDGFSSRKLGAPNCKVTRRPTPSTRGTWVDERRTWAQCREELGSVLALDHPSRR